MKQTTGAHLAKRQLEQLAVRAAQDFDAFYDSTEVDADATKTGDVLVLSFDGKGVVMRFEGLRPGTQKAAKKSTHKLTTRLSKGEKANRKRMAEVAAVRSRLHHRAVGPHPRERRRTHATSARRNRGRPATAAGT